MSKVLTPSGLLYADSGWFQGSGGIIKEHHKSELRVVWAKVEKMETDPMMGTG